ncbi:MAG: FHA domain-containing protein, partial [Verrucomicrobiae bacterium]|nr:FHA domain-containing protein [Verrucomicrobiae bacterium]
MPFFSRKRPGELSPDFEVTIESLPVDSPFEVEDVAVTVRHFPFRIGRMAKPGTGHRLTSDSLMLDDPRPHNVSREHCVLEAVDGHLTVRDLNSTLGTELNAIILGDRTG